MNTEQDPLAIEPEKPSVRFKDSVLAKIGSIALLMLLLLIPLNMIDSLLTERLERRDSTINEITSTWGKAQTIVGPLLIIPYQYTYTGWVEETVKDGDKEIRQQKEVVEKRIANAYFLPTQLTISGDLKPNQLHRGIYEAIVYTGHLKIKGEFSKLDFTPFKIADNDILWNEAAISFAISDLRGTHETLLVEANNQKLALTPGSLVPNFTSGVQTSVKGLINKEKNELAINLNLVLNGSSGLQIAPLGIQNKVDLKSSWQDPSFNGAFLPTQRELSPQGFNAQWQIPYYGRDYLQQWSDAIHNESFNANAVNSSLFGLSLVSPIDSYRNVERSIKYGVLFITLVFTAFFLFEVSGKIKIHPFQYLLVGAALCLFYLALLSLSEFISFIMAYSLAAIASTILITLYSMAVLKNGKRGLFIAGGLITTYSFLYVTLQATDYALLIGTIGLFIALSLVMYITRHIDWYAQHD
jgi:inner membrane protein